MARSSSVEEMLASALPEDPSLAAEFSSQVQKRTLIRRLESLRNLRGMTQADVAKASRIPENRIAEIENGLDFEMTVAELLAYARKVGAKVEVDFG